MGFLARIMPAKHVFTAPPAADIGVLKPPFLYTCRYCGEGSGFDEKMLRHMISMSARCEKSTIPFTVKELLFGDVDCLPPLPRLDENEKR